MNGSAIPGCSEQGYKFVYNVFGHFLFALQRVSAGILAVDDRYFVGITPESCSFVVQGIQNDEVKILAGQFILGMGYFVVGLKCKAYQALVFTFGLAQCSRNVVSRFQPQHQIFLFTFDLVVGCTFRRKVSHGSTKDSCIGICIAAVAA